jgi:hypothetical protein
MYIANLLNGVEEKIGINLRKKTTKLNQNLVFFMQYFCPKFVRFNKTKKRVEICVNEG